YTIADGNGGANYQPVVATADGAITPKALSISAAADNKIYDGTAASAVAPIVDGLAGGDTASARQVFDSINAGNRRLLVDNYTIADGNGGKNYQPVIATADGTITPKVMSISAAADNKVYDGTAASAVAPIVDGLAGGDSASARQVFDAVNAGSRRLLVESYTIADGNGGANYTVAINEAGGTITPKALTISATGDSKVYDGSAASGAAPIINGLVGSDTASARQVFDSANAGSRHLLIDNYTIADGNGGANYAAATVAARGVIARAPLSIRANDKVVPYTGAPFSGGNGVVYEGLVANETPAVLKGSLAYRGSAQGALSPGEYRIVPDGLESANYAIVNIDGGLTISRPTQLDPALSDARAAVAGQRVGGAASLFQTAGMSAEELERAATAGGGADPELRIVDGGMRLPAGLK
ncbi:MAG: YDG domain-containing protein, partial [Noviherbaspirillum sp.]